MNNETDMSAELQRLSFLPDRDAAVSRTQAAIQWQQGEMALPDSYLLESGQTLDQGKLAWQCIGPVDAPLIVVLGGISAHRGVCTQAGSGWWEAQCGAGKTLDTNRYRLLSIDWLGGCDASTGPRSAAQTASEFPSISTGDQARVLLLLLNRFGARRVHLLVGASYGGNVAQQLAALLGDRLRRLVLLSAAHRPAQFGVALRHVQRAILDLGNESAQALALARSLAVLGYRTAEGIEQRFHADPGSSGSGRIDEAVGGVTDWIDHHGAKFVQRFDADAYRCLGRSLDAHEIDPATIRVPTTLFAVHDDLTVPLSLLREYAQRAGEHCKLVEIASHYGHDAFLKEEGIVSALFAQALAVTP